MVGVQNLSIGLSVTLVVVTGALVGVMSITTGNQLLDDARQTGDEGVASCLDSGDADIKKVAARYLNRVTSSVEDRVLGVFGRGVTLLDMGSAMSRSVEPDLMTGMNDDWSFLNNTVKQFLGQGLMQNLKHGITQVGWRWSNGGTIINFVLHESQAIAAPGRIPFASVESQQFVPPLGSTGELGNNPPPLQRRFLMVGELGADGRMTNRQLPCYRFRHSSDDMPLADLARTAYGVCTMPIEFFYSEPHINRTDYIMIQNAAYPEMRGTELMPADQIVFGPTFAYYSWLLVQAHIAVTHPNMPDVLGPRQNGRVGYWTVTVSGEAISAVFEAMPLPEGAVLYCVDKHPWTGAIGPLVATSYGRLTGWTKVNPPGTTSLYDWRVPIPAVNHTFDANTTEPSVIAQHARYVVGTKPGINSYEWYANATETKFIEWADDAGKEIWFTVKHMKFYNLNWYISMLVPRESVMASIDASAVAIRQKNADDRAKADKDQERGMIVMVVVTVVAALVLIAASIMVTKMILTPIFVLGGEMASVATMKVEDVDLDRPFSSLEEVNDMQHSFKTMVRNLIEYKQYMPASILVDDDEDEEDTSDGALSRNMSGNHSGKDKSGGGKSRASQSSRMTAATKLQHAAANGAKLADASLKKKPVTVVCYNIRGWLQMQRGLSDQQFQELASTVAKALLDSVTANKGVTDLFSGDHFLVAHNAFSAQGTHKLSSLKAALAVADRIKDVPSPSGVLKMSYAACSGEARVGQMGCAGMKKVTVTSSTLPFVFALEKYNKDMNMRGVADHYCAKDLTGNFVLRAVDAVVFAKRSVHMTTAHGECGICVHEVVCAQEVGDDEWMYQLENAEASNPCTPWNSTFEAVLDQNWTVAAKEFEKVVVDENISNSEYARLERIIKGQEYKYVDIN